MKVTQKEKSTPALEQRLIQNTSLQSWSLPFRSPQGIRHVYLPPNDSIKVPANTITEDVIRYQKRKLITIKNA